MRKAVLYVSLFVLAIGFASIAQAQATRTWVSGVGDDVNPCSRTAPCKTFAGAISKTAAGGTISVLDPGGYGAVTITKSITIDGTAQISSTLNAGTNGIVINAASTDTIVIRNLEIFGAGTGLDGVRVLSAKAVHIEDCRIEKQSSQGIEVAPGANSVKVYVRRTDIRNNTSHGILVLPTGIGTVDLTVENSSLTQNGGNGIDVAGNNNRATVTGSVLNGNVAGVIVEQTSSTAFIESSTLAFNQFGVWSGNPVGNTPVVRLSRCLVVGNTTHGLVSTAGGGGGGTIVGFSNNTIVGNTGNNSVNSSAGQQ